MITQGKWNIDGGSNDKGDLFIWKKGEYYGGHAIATVHGEIEEGAEDNAKLIVAAPDLLAACEAVMREIEKKDGAAPPEVRLWSDVVESAIKAAKD